MCTTGRECRKPKRSWPRVGDSRAKDKEQRDPRPFFFFLFYGGKATHKRVAKKKKKKKEFLNGGVPLFLFLRVRQYRGTTLHSFHSIRLPLQSMDNQDPADNNTRDIQDFARQLASQFSSIRRPGSHAALPLEARTNAREPCAATSNANNAGTAVQGSSTTDIAALASQLGMLLNQGNISSSAMEPSVSTSFKDVPDPSIYEMDFAETFSRVNSSVLRFEDRDLLVNKRATDHGTGNHCRTLCLFLSLYEDDRARANKSNSRASFFLFFFRTWPASKWILVDFMKKQRPWQKTFRRIARMIL